MPPDAVRRRHGCVRRTAINADTRVVLQTGDHFALWARHGADVGAAAGGNAAEPYHAALPDSWKDRRALRTCPAPTRGVMDDVGHAGEHIRVRAALTIEIRGLRSIVLGAYGYAGSIDGARGHAVHNDRRRVRPGGRQRCLTSRRVILTSG